MHPIEGAIYKTAMFIPLIAKHHPLFIMLIKIELDIAAYAGHDGYEAPGGSGDWMHTVHHLNLDCNYGSPNAPFDWLFGSVDYGEYGKEFSEQESRY